MALRIRLRRMGRKNAPTYRIVVAENTMPRDGRIIASIGHYNPRTDPLTLSVDREKALHWLGHGAVPTDTVRALLKRAGVFRPEEQGVIAEATSAAVEGAKRAAAAAKGAAGRMAGLVENAAEKVAEAASSVRDAVAGGDEETKEPEAGVAAETPASPEVAAEATAAPEATAEGEEPAAATEGVEEPKG